MRLRYGFRVGGMDAYAIGTLVPLPYKKEH